MDRDVVLRILVRLPFECHSTPEAGDRPYRLTAGSEFGRPSGTLDGQMDSSCRCHLCVT